MPKDSKGRRFFRGESGRFERFEDHAEELQEELLEETSDEVSDGDDEIRDLWEAITGEMDYSTLQDFATYDNAVELFRQGWVDVLGDSGEDIVHAREEFFDLMEAYDISRDEFDWDAWRDWYEG